MIVVATHKVRARDARTPAGGTPALLRLYSECDEEDRMKRLVAALVLATFAMPLAAARVEIVLDVSGSMRAKAGDITRMEAAQRAVRATVS